MSFPLPLQGFPEGLHSCPDLFLSDAGKGQEEFRRPARFRTPDGDHPDAFFQGPGGQFFCCPRPIQGNVEMEPEP